MDLKIMKAQNTSIGMHSGTIRAGLISLSVLSICCCYLSMMPTGWDLPRTWLLIVSFAVCFVLMVSSVVELFVLAFTVAAKYSGIGAGRSVRLVRRIYRRLRRRRSR